MLISSRISKKRFDSVSLSMQYSNVGKTLQIYGASLPAELSYVYSFQGSKTSTGSVKLVQSSVSNSHAMNELLLDA
jgi:hypothetical protein